MLSEFCSVLKVLFTHVADGTLYVRKFDLFYDFVKINTIPARIVSLKTRHESISLCIANIAGSDFCAELRYDFWMFSIKNDFPTIN